MLLEIKKFSGFEKENRWRTDPKNKSRANLEDGDSLDVETARKIAASVATLTGANTFDASSACVAQSQLPDFLKNRSYFTPSAEPKKLRVVLLLEGKIGCETRSFPMIAQRLQNSLKKDLGWLNCRVDVVNADVVGASSFWSQYFTATSVFDAVPQKRETDVSSY